MFIKLMGFLSVALLCGLGRLAAQDCSGVPTAGTAAVSPGVTCPGSTVTLTLTGLSTENNIVLQWQSSTDYTTWKDVGGATDPTYSFTMTNGFRHTWYRAVVTCSGSGQSVTSNVVDLQTPLVASYRTLPFSEAFELSWAHICKDGQLPAPLGGGIAWNNTPVAGDNSWRRDDDVTGGEWSADLGGYSPGGSNSDHSARFHSTYGAYGTLDVYLDCSSGLTTKKLSFDYINTDGTDSMSVYLSTDGGATFSRLDTVGVRGGWASKIVYFTSSSDKTILRFAGYGDFGNSDIGLDNVQVQDVAMCSGVPTIGNAVSSLVSVCGATPFQLGLDQLPANVDGVVYQWQSSADGITGWQNIASAKDSTAVTTEQGTMWYRVLATCSVTNSTATSTSVKVLATSAAGTYTINSAQPTAGTNFNSFNDAYNFIKCGITAPVVIDVTAGSGPYQESLTMEPIPGSSAVNTITFNGNGATIQYSSANNSQKAVVRLQGADYISFNNLVIDASTTQAGFSTHYGIAVQLLDSANYNTFHQCTILSDSLYTTYNSGYHGVYIDYENTGETGFSNYNTFEGNHISGGYYGIYQGWQEKGNRFINNTISNFYLSGIYLEGGSSDAIADSILVEGNDIAKTARIVNRAYGVYASNVSNLSISKNRIHDLNVDENSYGTGSGIYLNQLNGIAGSATYVTNNVVYHMSGYTSYGVFSTGIPNVYVEHNTLSVDRASQNSNTNSYGFYEGYDQGKQVFKNNVVSVTASGVGRSYAVSIPIVHANLESDYNNFYITTSDGNYLGTNSGNFDKDLATWQVSSGNEAHSVTIDPAFANADAGNFKPTNPDIDDLGTPVGVTTDILGTTRSTTTPDLGAYEITYPECTAPPAGGKAMVTPDAFICMGDSIQLALNNYTPGKGQTYVWQAAASADGPWVNLTDTLKTLPDTLKLELGTLSYFRCVVMCSGQTGYSEVAHVSMNAGMPSGIYTIDKTAPTNYPTGRNFQSFVEAVAALECGIDGPVTFKVAANTYHERVRMHKVANSSNINRVTFESADVDASKVTLTYDVVDDQHNYVLQLDSASFITWKDITIVADWYNANTGNNGRAVDIAHTASYDSISHCVLTARNALFDGNNQFPVLFSSSLTGHSDAFVHNSIMGGNGGILLSSSVKMDSLVIRGNNYTGTGICYYGYQVENSMHLRMDSNTVNINGVTNRVTTGIMLYHADSSFLLAHNIVHLENTGTIPYSQEAYGIRVTFSRSAVNAPNRIDGNLSYVDKNNAGSVYGLITNLNYGMTILNNVMSVKTTGTNKWAAGFFSQADAQVTMYNNSVVNASTSDAGHNNYAAYFTGENATDITLKDVVVRNNIFSQTGDAIALYIFDPQYVNSDYNALYTTGSTLARTLTADYATLPLWRAATGNDINSIVYKPTLLADSVRPDVTDPEVWAIHGRGVQIAGNDHDFYNHARPVTLTEGVPDLGAYEFTPTSVPVALTATPAAPVAGATQTFMFGTDTVAKIDWAAGAPVPAVITMRRYSGVTPPNVTSDDTYMYFYTMVDDLPGAAYKYDFHQYFIDPWQAFFVSQPDIRLGKTNAAGDWSVNMNSKVDEIANVISDTNLTELYKYTGLLKGGIRPEQPTVQTGDSSNAGTDFWVPYGHHAFFEWSGAANYNVQDLLLFLATLDQPAHVTVSIPGLGYQKTYSLDARSAIKSNALPKTGAYDARLLDEGVYNKGIHITSDAPIQASAYLGGDNSVVSSPLNASMTGATMLLPTGTYGYDYTALITQQYGSYSWVNSVAAYDSTLLEVIPSQDSKYGHKAGVPFTVQLNKGEVFQLLGIDNKDLTGTTVHSIKNASGKCYPFAMFSGSSGTGITCSSYSGTTPSSDNLIQQNLPARAWGKHYFTVPTSGSYTSSTTLTNIYKVAVKDPATKVMVNGRQLGSLVDNLYYQYESSTADELIADQPVMVAQYMTGPYSCPGSNTDYGQQDPEMFYLTPVEHAVKKVYQFRPQMKTAYGTWGYVYLSLIVPTAGLPGLKIDGNAGFYDTYDCSNIPGYSRVVKRWDLQSEGNKDWIFTIESDTAFTGIVYGMDAGNESFGYNLGMKVDTVTSINAEMSNTYNTGNKQYTCVNTPVRFSVKLPVKPASIDWMLSQAGAAVPATDEVQSSPAAAVSAEVNGTTWYTYTNGQDVIFTQPGIYYVPVVITDLSFENCDHERTVYDTITVNKTFAVTIAAMDSICSATEMQFNGAADPAAPVTINNWEWNFADGTTASDQSIAKVFAVSGSYQVKLEAVASDGCVGDTGKLVVVTDCSGNIFIPSAFTPNGDGLNDVLRVYGNGIAEIEFMVFNQWGEKIFDSRDVRKGWDGTYNGKLQPSTVYEYVCKVTMVNGKKVLKKGAVNLIR